MPINIIFNILESIFLINIESSDCLADSNCSNANEYFSFEMKMSLIMI